MLAIKSFLRSMLFTFFEKENYAFYVWKSNCHDEVKTLLLARRSSVRKEFLRPTHEGRVNFRRGFQDDEIVNEFLDP